MSWSLEPLVRIITQLTWHGMCFWQNRQTNTHTRTHIWSLYVVLVFIFNLVGKTSCAIDYLYCDRFTAYDYMENARVVVTVEYVTLYELIFNIYTHTQTHTWIHTFELSYKFVSLSHTTRWTHNVDFQIDFGNTCVLKWDRLTMCL